MMEAYFESLADALQAALGAGERFAATFDAEETDFVRMNRGKVRQPGTVSQRYLSVRLIRGARHAEHTLSLSGDLSVDTAAARDALTGLRGVLSDLVDEKYYQRLGTVTSGNRYGEPRAVLVSLRGKW